MVVRFVPLLGFVGLVLFFPLFPVYADPFVKDDFSILSGWREVLFEEGDLPSTFEAHRNDDGSADLLVQTEGGSSMLISEEPINVNDTPILTWRWKLLEGLETADLSERRREDAAIRVVVSFRNPLEDLPWWLRIWAAHQERRHGEVPPTSAIMYAWGTQQHQEPAFPIPYTDRIQIVPVEWRPASPDQWRRVVVNVYEDHRTLFGGDPPEVAFVAVMSDSDNTGERGAALLDFIEFSAR